MEENNQVLELTEIITALQKENKALKDLLYIALSGPMGSELITLIRADNSMLMLKLLYEWKKAGALGDVIR